jgi:chromosome segregation ATPase
VSKPKPAQPVASGDSATTQEPATGPAANTSSPADQDAKTEAAWRQRFKEQREKISRAEKELDVLQREAQKAEIQYYPDPQKAMNEQYTRKEINDKDAKIEAKRKEIAELKLGLSDLEDALRKAGGDPGWARE